VPALFLEGEDVIEVAYGHGMWAYKLGGVEVIRSWDYSDFSTGSAGEQKLTKVE
jgi:hypothetical protein